MKTKKINITFIGLAVAFAVVGLVHTLWVYLSWILDDNYNSSAPAEVAFCIIVPYLLVSIAVLVAWQLYKKLLPCKVKAILKN